VLAGVSFGGSDQFVAAAVAIGLGVAVAVAPVGAGGGFRDTFGLSGGGRSVDVGAGGP